MKRNTTIIGIAASALLLASAVLVFTGNALVVGIPDAPERKDVSRTVGDKLNPIRDFAQAGGGKNLSAYIIIDPSDRPSLHPSIPRLTCLTTSDPDLIERLRDKVQFIYSGGDYATIPSRLLIFEGDSLIFRSGIGLHADGPEGLQAREYGWADAIPPGSLINICSQFTPVYSPIIIF